jgi:hypothetical protein
VHAASDTRGTVSTPCRLQIPSVAGDRAYYTFEPHSGWRCIFLDAFDDSLIGNHPDSEEYKEAWGMLAGHVNVCSACRQSGNAAVWLIVRILIHLLRSGHASCRCLTCACMAAMMHQTCTRSGNLTMGQLARRSWSGYRRSSTQLRLVARER